MSRDLYADRIIAEARARHAAGRLATPTASVTHDNPLCGDRVTLDVALEGGRVLELAHLTRGCLLTQAAASLLGRLAPGARPEELRAAHEELRRILATTDGEGAADAEGDLAMFASVRPVRSRHACVLLPFEALERALAEDGGAS